MTSSIQLNIKYDKLIPDIRDDYVSFLVDAQPNASQEEPTQGMITSACVYLPQKKIGL
jgi:hypothetical protein